MKKHRIGIIGLGKIAQDQHVPVIQAHPNFELAATSSRRGIQIPGVAHSLTDHSALLALSDIDTVVICTPPSAHYEIAREALASGKNVILEKPPTTSLSALEDLARRAKLAGRLLFTAWHAQYNAGVDRAKTWLTGRCVRRLQVNWKEDVRLWHPGQRWIWEVGGCGVFDSGINALSILTKILPEPLHLIEADLYVPENTATPIAADLAFGAGPDAENLKAAFDWRHTGEQHWVIEIHTANDARLTLSNGGGRLEIGGVVHLDAPLREYEGVYDHYAQLLHEGRSHVDAGPLRLVADAFLLGRRHAVESFYN